MTKNIFIEIWAELSSTAELVHQHKYYFTSSEAQVSQLH